MRIIHDSSTPTPGVHDVPVLPKTKAKALRELFVLLIATCCYYSGLISLVHWCTRRMGPRLVILNYHEASVGNLRQHLRYLRRFYRIEHAETALKELYQLPDARIKSRDKRVPLIMTFDDGYYDNYTYCLPLAKELKTPLTIFVIPDYIDSGKRFWWNECKRLLRYTPLKEVTLGGNTYRLDIVEEQKVVMELVDTRIRYAQSVLERENFLEQVHSAFAVHGVYEDEKAELPMTWDELREMEASGWISVGAHTVHHPILGYLSEYEEVKKEVENSRFLLEQQLGHIVNLFAYPVGKFEHIEANGLRAVDECNYHWAMTTVKGINTPHTDPLMLYRVEVNLWDHWLVMAAKLAGVFDFLLSVRKFFTGMA